MKQVKMTVILKSKMLHFQMEVHCKGFNFSVEIQTKNWCRKKRTFPNPPRLEVKTLHIYLFPIFLCGYPKIQPKGQWIQSYSLLQPSASPVRSAMNSMHLRDLLFPSLR